VASGKVLANKVAEAHKLIDEHETEQAAWNPWALGFQWHTSSTAKEASRKVLR